MGSNTMKAARRRLPSKGGKRRKAEPRRERPGLTLRDLGWTREQAMTVRGKLSGFGEDWDDPRMDVYDAP